MATKLIVRHIESLSAPTGGRPFFVVWDTEVRGLDVRVGF
jgi:hypothetical protein